MKGLFILIYATFFILGAEAAKAIAIATDSNKYIRLKLAGDGISVTDETIILFKNNTTPAYKAGEDAVYFQGAGQIRLFSYSTNRIALVFNLQPFPVKTADVYLNVFARFDGRYQLKMPEIVGVPNLFDIWLVDNLLKDSIDLRQNPSYSFNISKADTNTFGGRRFKLVIKHITARDCHLLDFTADKIAGAKQVQLKWHVENEGNYTNYTVEHSTDNGKTFKALDSLRSDSKGFYSLTDKAPVNSLNLYRLKQTDFSNSISYSATVRADYTGSEVSNAKSFISNTPNIYPNPVDNQLNVVMNNKTPMATYTIAITNIWGLKVKEGTTSNAQWQSEVSDLKSGMYMVVVTNNSDKSVVGYNKFLKK